MANKRSKKKNDLVPILLIGGGVILYFYLTRKKAIITVGPMSDPTWNAAEDYTPPGYEQPYQSNPFPSILDNDLWMTTEAPPAQSIPEVYYPTVQPTEEIYYPESGGGGGSSYTPEDEQSAGRFNYFQEMQGEINGARRRRSRIRGIVPVTS